MQGRRGAYRSPASSLLQGWQIVLFSTNWVMPPFVLELFNLKSGSRERSGRVAQAAVINVCNSE
jgi:hypothetical protein